VAEVFELCDEASGVGFVVAPGVSVGAEVLIRLVSFQHPVSRHQDRVGGRDLRLDLQPAGVAA
jgi:hypothetical protein